MLEAELDRDLLLLVGGGWRRVVVAVVEEVPIPKYEAMK
jgi:hypothetical protein